MGNIPDFGSRRYALMFAALLLVIWLVIVLVSYAKGQEAPTPVAVSAAASASTPVQTPPGVQVNTGNTELARLALEQGRADSAVLDWVLANSGPIKGDTRAGELRIAFTVTPAEGWWDKAGGDKLAWHDAPAGDVHLRIFVVDGADGRLVPGLTVRARLVDANGNEQSVPVDFGWYPLLNAYGGNLPLEIDSRYTLRVTVDPLGPQHSFSEDDRLTHGTIAEFPPVQISRDALAQLPPATTTAFNGEAELLKPVNAALSAAITALWQHSASGSEKPSGDYFVGYALNYSTLVTTVPKAMLRIRNMIHMAGTTELRVVLFPRDSRTGRLLQGIRPQVNIIAADGTPYGPGEVPLLWHSWFNHYGRSIQLARKNTYKLHVHFDAPGFRRWGRQSERFAAPLDVEFDDVSLKAEAAN